MIIDGNSDLAKRLLFQATVDQWRRAASMPTEKDALRVLFDAYERLRELGWREWIYMPKDGTEVQLIEAGSTGVHRGHYQGKWPKGSVWIAEDGDLWPSHPILFKAIAEKTP